MASVGSATDKRYSLGILKDGFRRTKPQTQGDLSAAIRRNYMNDNEMTASQEQKTSAVAESKPSDDGETG
ncbi:MAG TPA: hypothetical protein VLI72_07785 [Methylibium sp.]|nr:hypothetical protein [Methylibium sp.]